MLRYAIRKENEENFRNWARNADNMKVKRCARCFLFLVLVFMCGLGVYAINKVLLKPLYFLENTFLMKE